MFIDGSNIFVRWLFPSSSEWQTKEPHISEVTSLYQKYTKLFDVAKPFEVKLGKSIVFIRFHHQISRNVFICWNFPKVQRKASLSKINSQSVTLSLECE